MARIIGVFSGKGGVGKTTFVANIGAALAHDFGRRVVAVDANTSGSSLGVHLGMHFNPLNLNNVLRGEAGPFDALSEHGSGMWVLPASIKLRDYFVGHSKIPDVIGELAKRFEIVLVDTAPSLGEETLWVLNAVNEAIIVTNPDLPSVIEALKMAKLVNTYGVKLLGVVLNRQRKKAPLSKEQVMALLGLPLIGEIPEDRKVEEGIKYSIPVVHLYPDAKVSLAMKKIAGELIGEHFQYPSLFQMLKRRLGL